MSYNQPPQYNPNNYYGAYDQTSLANKVTDVMKRVYLKMTFGVLITAIVAWFCASSPAFISFIANNSWSMWAILIGWFALGAFVLPMGINKMSDAAANGLFYLFSAISGLMFFSIFLAYSTTVIAKTFFITAGTFGAMSIYGYCTNRDLSKMGSILMMALFGLIIASVVNIFWHNEGLDSIISYVGVLIFVGLTAWDTQQVKNMAQAAPAAMVGKLAIMGALNLYLDFINLFLFLLRIFGGGSRD